MPVIPSNIDARSDAFRANAARDRLDPVPEIRDQGLHHRGVGAERVAAGFDAGCKNGHIELPKK